MAYFGRRWRSWNEKKSRLQIYCQIGDLVAFARLYRTLTSNLRVCAGELTFNWFTFNDIRELLCKPGNGIALDGKYAIDFRLWCGCSAGLLNNGLVNNEISLSINCSPQSHSGRNIKLSWNWWTMGISLNGCVKLRIGKMEQSLTFFLAAWRSCSELNWNVSNMGTNAESHNVVKYVSEYSNSDGNCCNNCHVQSKNNSNNGLCSVVSLLITWPNRSL